MKWFTILLVLVSCISCSNDKSDKEFIIALNNNLKQGNSYLADHNETIIHSLESYRDEPEYADRATVWFAKAQKVHVICNEFENGIIAGISTDHELFTLIEKLKKNLAFVDPLIYKEYQNDLINFPYTNNNQKDSLSIKYSTLSDASKQCYITTLVQQLNFLENRVLGFCHNKVKINYSIRDYGMTTPWVTQNSTVVVPSEAINIVAGFATYTPVGKPSITIDGHIVPVDNSSTANYSFQAPSKPGKYTVPVRMSFKDQDGITQTVSKAVEFKVKDCKQ